MHLHLSAFRSALPAETNRIGMPLWSLDAPDSSMPLTIPGMSLTMPGMPLAIPLLQRMIPLIAVVIWMLWMLSLMINVSALYGSAILVCCRSTSDSLPSAVRSVPTNITHRWTTAAAVPSPSRQAVPRLPGRAWQRGGGGGAVEVASRAC